MQMYLSNKSGKTKSRLRIGMMVFVVVSVMGLCVGAVACAPAKAPAPSNATDASSTMVANQAFVPSSGDFPDTRYNTELLNSGKRGCNSCHDDLFDMMDKQEPAHIVTHSGFDKSGTVDDCLSCHRFHRFRVGPYMGDIVHASHYNNKTFAEDQNGNCWSCHAVNSAGKMGEDQWVLFDEFKYSADFGGYIPGSNSMTRAWVASRSSEWADGYITGIATDKDMNMTVDLVQQPTNEEENFVVHNWGPKEVKAEDYTFTLEGVKNPVVWTLDQLKAMPQTSMTLTQHCYTSNIGSPFYANMPVKGVSFDYLIEQSGGLIDGITRAHFFGLDGWDSANTVNDFLSQSPILALEAYGKPLTIDQGFPATVMIPGMPGGCWVKMCNKVAFEVFPNAVTPYAGPYDADGSGVHPVNTSILANDGVEFKLGSPVQLKGFSWTWEGVDGPSVDIGCLDTIKFSADYGETWHETKVPESFDPFQLTEWNISWTPPKEGTYILKIMAVDSNGNAQFKPENIIVKVTQ